MYTLAVRGAHYVFLFATTQLGFPPPAFPLPSCRSHYFTLSFHYTPLTPMSNKPPPTPSVTSLAFLPSLPPSISFCLLPPLLPVFFFFETPRSGPPSLHHFARSSLVDWLEDYIHGYLRVCVCLCVCAAFSTCTRVFDVVKGERTTMKK